MFFTTLLQAGVKDIYSGKQIFTSGDKTKWLAARMRGVKPNEAMKRRHDIMREIGCIVCHKAGHKTPAQIHHIDGCKDQEAHSKTLALCIAHHMNDQIRALMPSLYTSRHPNKKAFEERYGTEHELLEYQNQLIAEHTQL